MWKSLNETGSWQGEVWNRHKSGSTYVELVAIDKVDDQQHEESFFVAVFSDITRIKNHEKELHRIAHYDQLTGLPNRRLLNDRLDQSLAHAERAHKPLALCFLDLDGFKAINDKHGHSTGDKVLVHLTNTLQQALRKGDTIARLGGDEFVILLSELNNTEEINTALNRILSLINKPITIEGLTLSISASIGATIFPADNVDSESLLRHADQAMYAAKEAGKNRYSIFDPQHAHDIQEHYTYQQRLANALMNEEFVLFYQPKVNLVSGEVVGVEALIRWQHPNDGLLSPNKFLHYIEGSPLEIPMSEWVLQSAFKEVSSGLLSNHSVAVSINISAHHLQSESFIPYLQFLFEQYPSIKQRVIEFEILETQAFTDFEAAINIIHECKAMGIRFALDDFGTGYSSLTYLQRLPFDILKIDQSFVINMLNDSNDLGIIDSVVRLARAFNREVIAEGVETIEHAKILLDYHCYQGQGYGIGYPMPASDFPAWLAHWNKEAIWEKLTQHTFE
jgi:diguanylate cyclase (GGDEF)-like protein